MKDPRFSHVYSRRENSNSDLKQVHESKSRARNEVSFENSLFSDTNIPIALRKKTREFVQSIQPQTLYHLKNVLHLTKYF